MFSKTSKAEEFRLGAVLRRWSIERRLTVLFAGLSSLMLLLAGTYLYWSLSEETRRDDNAFLANRIQECRRLLNGRPEDLPLLAHEVQTEANASQFIKYYVRVMTENKVVQLETSGMSELLPDRAFPRPFAASDAPSHGTVWKSPAGVSYLVVAARAMVSPEQGGERILQAALDVSGDSDLLEGYRWRLIAVAGFGIVFSCIAGVFAARKALAPLREITKVTRQISASNLNERISPSGWPVELASLAGSFDQMLGRLEESFTRLSQFSADLAHELRTPVNNLRGEAGVTLSKPRTAQDYRQTLESSLEEYARLSRLIDNMLFLARADGANQEIVKSRCDARKAVDIVCEFYGSMAEQEGIEIRCEGFGLVHADAQLFRQAVSNLLSNALHHCSRGDTVTIKIGEAKDDLVEISVNDTGCGISAEHVPRVFERFYRVDPARSGNGAGLGLAIVKSIMKLHGGTVDARSEPGRGSTFTLTFPAAKTVELTKM